ncbi:hypothetical protein BDR07DRAFT_1390500 [Suillus spraguei]|nr:hypothetical protein BDR07DRAFT_1390500 [Suillus spraguei]
MRPPETTSILGFRYYVVECGTATQERAWIFAEAILVRGSTVDRFLLKHKERSSAYKSKVSSYLFRFTWSHITSSPTMRFTFSIIFAVIAALASSISATPIETSTKCPTLC